MLKTARDRYPASVSPRRSADPVVAVCCAAVDVSKIGFALIALLLLAGCQREREPGRQALPPIPANTVSNPATPAACTAAPRRLCPVDEASRDESFATFRRELAAAVEQNNEARLLTLVDPAVRTSFGGDGGHAAFKSHWKDAQLDKILRLGGTFRGRGDEASFWAPYVYSAWPEGVDAFQHVAAIRAGVPIRRNPSADAETVATVDWAILEVRPSESQSREWVRVKEGWVHADDVHSPVGYRAGFSKRSGRWLLDALVAGD